MQHRQHKYQMHYEQSFNQPFNFIGSLNTLLKDVCKEIKIKAQEAELFWLSSWEVAQSIIYTILVSISCIWLESTNTPQTTTDEQARAPGCNLPAAPG